MSRNKSNRSVVQNESENGKANGDNKADQGASEKEQRGLLAIANNLFHKYNAETAADKKGKESDRFWVKIGVVGAIIYTAITGVIMAVSAFQAWTARDTERRQLRAYVGIVPGDVEDFGAPEQRLRMVRKNNGSTPAYDVGFSTVGFGTIYPGQPIQTPPESCAVPPSTKLGTMFPGTESKWEIKINSPFSPDVVQAVKSGSAYLVYYGDICYHDAFGDPHFTHYCWMYKGQSLAAKDAEGCLGYNDSD